MKVKPIKVKQCFNPRTPAGCDLMYAKDGNVHIEVSIHAPLRGATRLP